MENLNIEALTLDELKAIHSMYLKKVYPIEKDRKQQYNKKYKQKFTKEEINKYQRERYQARKAAKEETITVIDEIVIQ